MIIRLLYNLTKFKSTLIKFYFINIIFINNNQFIAKSFILIPIQIFVIEAFIIKKDLVKIFSIKRLLIYIYIISTILIFLAIIKYGRE